MGRSSALLRSSRDIGTGGLKGEQPRLDCLILHRNREKQMLLTERRNWSRRNGSRSKTVPMNLSAGRRRQLERRQWAVGTPAMNLRQENRLEATSTFLQILEYFHLSAGVPLKAEKVGTAR